MRYTTKTEYGLVCLLYMAKKMPDYVVTIKEIVQTENFSESYIEKIFQTLRGANIVTSHKGKNGGYALTRQPSEITLKVVIEALEGHTFDVYCEPETREGIVCNHFCMCGVRPIWTRTKQMLDQLYDSITLATLAGSESEVRQKVLVA